MIDEILLIMLVLSIAWYWWDTQRSNEMALGVCRQKCLNAGLQLLDATITRQRTWLRRGDSGQVQICRLYSFEYSDDQASDYGQREHGYIVLIGKQVVETSMPRIHEKPMTVVNPDKASGDKPDIKIIH
ncbi:MAG: DUF3301 domain-containing protein [Proteobacteria bacterium]|nr:DUF3301 domain-containing protein [Pseudomonadota bacterium]